MLESNRSIYENERIEQKFVRLFLQEKKDNQNFSNLLTLHIIYLSQFHFTEFLNYSISCHLECVLLISLPMW